MGYPPPQQYLPAPPHQQQFLPAPPLPQQYQAPQYFHPPTGAASNAVDHSALMSALHNLSIQSPSGGWVADSGASSHLAADPGMLSSVATLSNYPPVFVGNGSAMPISHVGSSCLPNPNRPLYLNNVLVAPNLIKNLLSVRRLTTDNNCSVEFDRSRIA